MAEDEQIESNKIKVADNESEGRYKQIRCWKMDRNLNITLGMEKLVFLYIPIHERWTNSSILVSLLETCTQFKHKGM